MKKLFLILALGALNARADFQMGGELVNPGRVPHSLPAAQVEIMLPEGWAVEKTDSEILASELAVSETILSNSQIELKAGSDIAWVQKQDCRSVNYETYRKTHCRINDYQGVVLLEQNGKQSATLSYTQGSHMSSYTTIQSIVRSLKPVN